MKWASLHQSCKKIHSREAHLLIITVTDPKSKPSCNIESSQYTVDVVRHEANTDYERVWLWASALSYCTTPIN